MIKTKIIKFGVGILILLSISLYAPSFAQVTNQTQDIPTQLNLGSNTPVVGYKTESGGFAGMYKHVTFDSKSMQVMEVDLNSPPEFNVVSNSTFDKFIQTLMNSNFFQIESPSPTNCADCINYIITIAVPTVQGTLANTVAFDDQLNFSEKQDAELMLRLIELMNNMDNPFIQY